MKKGWQTKTLGELLAVLRNGVNCKQDRSGSGDKVSRIESISDATFDIERVGYAQLKERDKERFRLQHGDILFSHINSAIHVGKTAVFDSDEEVYHGVNLLLMRPSSELTSSYLEYSLKFLFQSGYWQGVCKQSINQASVNQQDIARVRVSFPTSLKEQQRIVAVLDEAFAGLAIAQAHAEKNLQNARELFDSYLEAVFTKRGKGWVKKPLEAVTTILNGYAFKSADFSPNACVKCIKITNVGIREFVAQCDSYLPAGFSKEYSPVAVKSGSIVIALTRTIISGGLKVAVVPDEYDRALLNQRVAAIQTDAAVLGSAFLFAYLSTQAVADYVIQHVNTLMQPNLSIADLRTLPVPVPPREVQYETTTQLDALAAETQRLQKIYEQKLVALVELKKSLLHQAFSGEL
jgi:type I restriction enzyme S subunit